MTCLNVCMPVEDMQAAVWNTRRDSSGTLVEFLPLAQLARSSGSALTSAVLGRSATGAAGGDHERRAGVPGGDGGAVVHDYLLLGQRPHEERLQVRPTLLCSGLYTLNTRLSHPRHRGAFCSEDRRGTGKVGKCLQFLQETSK